MLACRANADQRAPVDLEGREAVARSFLGPGRGRLNLAAQIG